MHKSHLIISLFLFASLPLATASAADAASAPANAPAQETTLEKIDGTPAVRHDMKDCPTNLKKDECKYDKKKKCNDKECQHKKGEPCPFEKAGGMDAAQHDMKDCPTNLKKDKCKYDNKKCQHKKGEPCPVEQNGKQAGTMKEKCDYKKK